jgi:hypothetical protein
MHQVVRIKSSAVRLAPAAELVVRELEKDAVQSATEAAGKDAGPERYMMRSVACFQHQGVAFVDTQLSPAWQALHCNLAFTNVSDVAGPRTPAVSIRRLRLLH